jgi:RimJ/RimL family protein N-acetyltransferase
MNNYLRRKSTQRLIIRPLKLSDAKIWEAFILSETATRYFPDNFKLKPELSEKWIASQLQRYRKDGYGLMALEDMQSGKFVGQCGLLLQEVNGREEVEIGYHLLPKYWGKGYAIEAAQEFKRIGFEEEEATSLISLIHPDNRPSQKVAQRNGMQKSGECLHKGLAADIFRIDRESYFRNTAS